MSKRIPVADSIGTTIPCPHPWSMFSAPWIFPVKWSAEAAVWQRHSPFRVDEGVLRGVYRLAVHGSANEVTGAWPSTRTNVCEVAGGGRPLRPPPRRTRRADRGQSGKQPRPTLPESRCRYPVHTAPFAPTRCDQSTPQARCTQCMAALACNQGRTIAVAMRAQGNACRTMPAEDSDLACQSA